MNPILMPLIILGAVIIWFLLSFLFKPIGNYIYKIWKDVVDQFKEDQPDSKDDNKE